jgi:TetR/AcrR family transcriptional regulator
LAKIAGLVESPRRGGPKAVRLTMDEISPIDGGAATEKKRRTRSGKKRAEEVKDAILQAALECYGAFGYDGTSTRAIADHAKVTHTLVLYHFGSKEELWTATLDKALSSYVATISPIFENSDGSTYGTRLRRFIEEFVRFSARYPQIHRIMTMEGNQDTERLAWVIENHLRSHFERVRELIRRGQDEGSVRDFDATRLYYFIIGGSGTLYTLSMEYKALTGRDVFSETEILRNLAFLYEIVFTST